MDNPEVRTRTILASIPLMEVADCERAVRSLCRIELVLNKVKDLNMSHTLVCDLDRARTLVQAVSKYLSVGGKCPVCNMHYIEDWFNQFMRGTNHNQGIKQCTSGAVSARIVEKEASHE